MSIRTLHVLKRTRNERCTVPTLYGELCASVLGLLPYLSETSYVGYACGLIRPVLKSAEF